MSGNSWPFDVPPETAVLTTSYVTSGRLPILFVAHEFDEEEGIIWQFHCGNGDYSNEVLQLVRLDEVTKIDASILGVSGLPVGFCARRSSASDAWVFEKEDA